MNILIVDDDYLVLEGIRKGIDWDTMPFEHVYLAQSVKQAKEILQTNPIDVLVSDIEMPQENGLDLLRWIRGQGLCLENIFLTCYADFQYAQQAIELGSFHYFLKPIEYDKLRQIIINAAAKAKHLPSPPTENNWKQYWFDNVKEVRDAFWSRILAHPEALERQSIPPGLSYAPADPFFLLFFALFLPEGGPSWQGFPSEYAFRNIAAELFSFPGVSLESIVPDQEERYFVILKAADPVRDQAELVSRIARLIEEYRRHFCCEVSCFWSEAAPLSRMGREIVACREASPYLLNYLNRIVCLREFFPPQALYTPPDLEQIAAMLRAGNQEGIFQAVDGYLDSLQRQHKISENVLSSFLYDMVQLIFSYLAEQGIEAHRLFADSDEEPLSKAALHSTGRLRKHLSYLVRRAVEYSNLVKDNQSVAQRLRSYMDSHLGENISRATLSDLVFLNADYLARLFKQEMNQSISAYLLERRMERAGHLLRETRIPVNQIAEDLGYENNSYFSKLFRQKYGVTPVEYRRRWKQGR